ncbi:MAG: glutathione peroxidase [Bdellovibrionota bacterium]
MAALLDIPVKKIDGTSTTLAEFKGKVVLVVNVASKCGLTPQYEALEKMYEKYAEKGFVVLGFPANEFKGQEPGTNEEIKEFCTLNFGVKFPLMEKIVVKGPGQHPLYKELTTLKPKATTKALSGFAQKLKGAGLLGGNPQDIMWNFEKFLINKKGEVIERFAPDMTPDDEIIVSKVEEALNA